MIETFAFPLPVRQLQPFFAPQTLDPLVVHMPTFGAEQLTNLAIALPTILFSQPDQGRRRSSSVLAASLY